MKISPAGYALSFVLALASAACTAQTSSSPPPLQPAEGSVVVDWSISGSKDPNACSQSVASDIDIRIYDTGGGFVGEFQQACTAFATTIQLTSGGYTATAVLVDGGGAARTSVVDINPFTIRGNVQLDVPIDFPPNSFR